MTNRNIPHGEFNFSGHYLENYRLVHLLGSGGFASVYMAQHKYLERPVAIKLLRTVLDDDKDKLKFLEEARILANLSHPHIIHVLEFSIAEKWSWIQGRHVKETIPFLVMDYAPGGNLRNLYSHGSALSADRVVTTIKQVASALQYAHNQYIIHRDIKPENLLMNERNEIILSDFGLALFAPSPEFLSLQGMTGTLPYSAPEQLQGKPVFASDQYSLGIIAYEWLCGSRPFSGDDVEIIMHHMSTPPPPLRHRNPSLYQSVEDVVLKALAKDPKQRYPSVTAFAQALEQANQPHASFSPGLSGIPVRSLFGDQSTFPTFRYIAQKTVTTQLEQNPSTTQPATGGKDNTSAIPSSSTQRNRLRMIQKVRTLWIKGVLENSLPGGSLIPLELEEKTDAVDNPWPSPLLSRKKAQTFALGTSITQIYDQAGGELLILGEAGSGKTTLLLELARHLLNRAEQNTSAPMPVVFLLSSWAEKQLPLEQWLISELNSKYQVPRPLGEQWLHDEMLLPLLDGLDEVGTSTRSACVTAINTYKKEHGLSSLVVSSRLTDYLLFPPRVILQTAVVVRPLTLQQSENYLKNAGGNFEAIAQMLREDLALQHLVTTPLMLNIIILAYQNKSPAELLHLHTPEARYHQILSTYVEQMLHRHAPAASCSPEQYIDQLSYLARKMQQQGERVFYIEQIQPTWINKDNWLKLYMWLAVLLPGALIGAIMINFGNNLFFDAGNFVSIGAVGIYGGLMGYLFSGRNIAYISSKTRSIAHNSTKKPIRPILGTVLFLTIVSYLVFEFDNAGTGGIPNAIAVGIVTLILTIVRQNQVQHEPAPEAHENSLFKHARIALFVGFVFGENTPLRRIFHYGLFNRSFLYLIVSGLRDSLRNGLIGLLLNEVLIKRNDGAIHRSEIVTWSWKRFWHCMLDPLSLLRGVLIGSAIGLGYALTLGLPISLSSTISLGLSTSLLIILGHSLVASVLVGISSRNLDDHYRNRPNEGIRRSFKHGLIGGIIGALLFALFYILSNALHFAISDALPPGKKGLTWSSAAFRIGFLHGLHVDIYNMLTIGILGGLLAALLLGWLACLQHYLLRLVLRFTTPLPLHLSGSLDYAVRCAFLFKVGGGYMFIHRLLLEYFASARNGEVLGQQPLAKAEGLASDSEEPTR